MAVVNRTCINYRPSQKLWSRIIFYMVSHCIWLSLGIILLFWRLVSIGSGLFSWWCCHLMSGWDGVCVSEGRTGWELDVFSIENDVLKVSITEVKSDGGTIRVYNSLYVAGINSEHRRQEDYLLPLWQNHKGDMGVPLTWSWWLVVNVP